MKPCYTLPVALVLASCADSTSLPSLDGIDGLDEGWNALPPGGETICSDGLPERFFVRKTAPVRLVLYFQGGGTCWRGDNCDRAMAPTYKPTVGEGENPAHADDMFDPSRNDNPFSDWSVAFVPYCTAATA